MLRYLQPLGRGYSFDTSIVEVEVDDEYTGGMSDVKTLSTDEFVITPVKIGKTTLYDIKFLQKEGQSSQPVSKVRLTETQIGLLHQEIYNTLKETVQYPHDVFRDADKLEKPDQSK